MFRRAAAAAGLLLALAAGGLLFVGGTWASNLGYVGAAALGAVLCATGARRQRTRRLRLAWHTVAAGEATWAVANVWWLWYESVRREPMPVPSAYDVAYVVATLLVIAGVTMLLRPALEGSSPARLLVDGLLVTSSLFYVAWTVLLRDLPGLDGSVERAVTWVYPILDLATACVALLALSRGPRVGRQCWLLLSGGMVQLAVCDSVWAYENLKGAFASGGLIDLLWLAGYLLIGLAALTSPGTRREADPQVRDRWTAFVPFAPVVLVLVVSALDLGRGDPVQDVAGIVAIALLVVRQILAMVENHRLARDLESRVITRTVELARSEALFRAVGDAISDVVIVLEADMTMRSATAGLHRISGYHADELAGRGVLHLLHRADIADVVSVAEEVAGEPGASRMIACRVRVADGSFAWAEVTMANLLDHPQIHGYLLVIRDISEQRDLEERHRHRAEHDELTGLANRSAITERVSEMIGVGASPTVLLLDLDGFKAVNDSLGHAVGDELLRAVARRLRAEVRPDDVVGRLGGDEFAIVVSGSPFDAVQVAARVVDALDAEFELGARTARCRASVGVASTGSTADDLLRNADLAMYAAKAQGRNRFVVFHEGLHERVVRRLALEEDLRKAIGAGDLRLAFQPIVDIRTGAILGAEALVRWELDGKNVDPVEFISIAEESALICEMGRWVLDTACATAAEWSELRPDGPLPSIAVNVSARQLVDGDIVTDVRAALAASGLDAACLTVELTESAVMEHTDEVAGKLAALRALGVRVSIDDFGTGYSSLGRLQHLPADEIKIDRSFVGVIEHADDEVPVVDAVLALARTLHLNVVAEGIETDAQRCALLTAGCHAAQGYLYGRPMAADEIAARLVERRVDQPVG